MIQPSGGAAAANAAAPGTGPLDGTRALAGAILAGEPAAFGPRLVVVEGPSAGTVFALHDGAVLGRGRGAELCLCDPLASRRHAVFTLRDGGARLRDLSSKNGLSVNGRRVGPAGVALVPGDALVAGESVLVYEERRPHGSPGAAPEAEPPRSPSRAGRAAAVAARGLAALALMVLAALLALAAG